MFISVYTTDFDSFSSFFSSFSSFFSFSSYFSSSSSFSFPSSFESSLISFSCKGMKEKQLKTNYHVKQELLWGVFLSASFSYFVSILFSAPHFLRRFLPLLLILWRLFHCHLPPWFSRLPTCKTPHQRKTFTQKRHSRTLFLLGENSMHVYLILSPLYSSS